MKGFRSSRPCSGSDATHLEELLCGSPKGDVPRPSGVVCECVPCVVSVAERSSRTCRQGLAPDSRCSRGVSERPHFKALTRIPQEHIALAADACVSSGEPLSSCSLP